MGYSAYNVQFQKEGHGLPYPRSHVRTLGGADTNLISDSTIFPKPRDNNVLVCKKPFYAFVTRQISAQGGWLSHHSLFFQG